MGKGDAEYGIFTKKADTAGYEQLQLSMRETPFVNGYFLGKQSILVQNCFSYLNEIIQMYFKIAWCVLKANELTACSPTPMSQNVTPLKYTIYGLRV